MAKVLTVKQPFAQLIVLGLKKYETRPWGTKYRGELYIHASKQFDYEYIKLCEENEYFREAIPNVHALECGKIIGKVDIVGVQYTDTMRSILSLHDTYEGKRELAFGDYSEGRKALKLENPVEFSNPINVTGQLGIWDCHLPLHMLLSEKIKEVVHG
jgi:activating signal cointegrator 1